MPADPAGVWSRILIRSERPGLINVSVANQAARLALTDADCYVDDVIWQVSDSTLWLVTAVSAIAPCTFVQIGTGVSSGSFGPYDATYVTLTTNATLTNERTLAVGTGLALTDAGAGSTVTLSLDSTLTQNARVAVSKDGTLVGTRRGINFITGTNITLTVTDNSGSERVDVQIDAAGSGGGGGSAPTTATYITVSNDATLTAERVIAFGTGISGSDGGANNNYTISLDATLVALSGLNSTAGLVEQTGADTFTKRLIGVTNSTDIPTRSDADSRYLRISNNLSDLASAATALTNLTLQTGSTDIAANARVGIYHNGTLVAKRRGIDFRDTGYRSWSITDDSGNEQVDVTWSASFTPAPYDEQFLVLAASSNLSAERVIAFGTGISGSDGGANNNYTISLDATLVALSGLNSTAGLVEQTGADTFTKRLIGVTNSTDIPTRNDADSRYLRISNNLSDLASASTGRTNLGLDDSSVNLGCVARIKVYEAGTLKSTRRQLNFVAGTNITIGVTDDSPGGGDYSTVTISASGGGGGAPTDAQYVTLATNGTLSAERVLTAGTGITVTDAGAGSTVTIAVTNHSYALLNAVPEDTILGRTSSGTGAVEALTPTQTSEMLKDWNANQFYNYLVNPTISSTTPYTIGTGDNGKTLFLSGTAVQLPNNMAVGFSCTIVQDSSSQITFSALTDATLNSRSSYTKTAVQNSMAVVVVKSNSDGAHAVWYLGGDISS